MQCANLTLVIECIDWMSEWVKERRIEWEDEWMSDCWMKWVIEWINEWIDDIKRVEDYKLWWMMMMIGSDDESDDVWIWK